MKKLLAAILAFLFTFTLVPFQATATEENPFEKFDILWEDVASGGAETLLPSELNIDLSYIVKFKQDIPLTDIYQCVSMFNYNQLAKSEMRLFAVETADITNFYKKYSDRIDTVEKDSFYMVEATTNDTYYSDQWAIEALNIDDAWNISTGSDIKVAVLDTGIMRTHEDFIGVNIAKGYDLTTNTAYVNSDTVGHGTMVSSVICAKRNNNKGIAGVTDLITLVPYRLSNTENITISNSTKAIIMAADAGCKVINMSYGGTDYTASENDAVQYAIKKGCIVIASAGNSGSDQKCYPAGYNNVISVGAVNDELSRAVFSNYNFVDVMAPGVGIKVATKDGGYSDVSGTSFSSPYVAGIAALALSANPKLTTIEFEALLQMTSTDIDILGFDRYTGWGIVNAQQVVYRADKTIVTGVADGGIYYTTVKPVFPENCKALLDGKIFTSGSEISQLGKHLLIVYDGQEVCSFYFTIAEQFVNTMKHYIQGERFSQYYCSTVTVTYSGCSASLDGQPIKSGHIINSSGFYTIEFYDDYGNFEIVSVVIILADDETRNRISGVEEGGTYYGETKVVLESTLGLTVNGKTLEYGKKSSDGVYYYDKYLIFYNSGKFTISITIHDISYSVSFTIYNEYNQITLSDYNTILQSKLDEESGLIYSIKSGNGCEIQFITYDCQTLEQTNVVNTSLHYGLSNNYIGEKYIIVGARFSEKYIKYMTIDDLKAGSQALRTINHTANNAQSFIVCGDYLFLYSYDSEKTNCFCYDKYDLTTGTFVNSYSFKASQIYYYNENYNILYCFNHEGSVGTRTLEYRDMNMNLLSSLYVGEIKTMFIAENGSPVINGIEYSPTTATAVGTGLVQDTAHIGFIGDYEIRNDGIYKDGILIISRQFKYVSQYDYSHNQNDVFIGEDNDIYFFVDNYITVYENSDFENDAITLNTVCKLCRISCVDKIDLSKPFEMNNGRTGIYLQSNVQYAKWDFDEKNRLIYLYVGTDSSFVSEIYALNMDDFSIKERYSPAQFGVRTFNTVYFVNGYICVFTEASLNIYDPLTKKIVKQYTDINFDTGSFSNATVSSKGNLLVINGLFTCNAIDIMTGSIKRLNVDHPICTISDDAKYIYYINQDSSNNTYINCYDFQAGKVVYQTKQTFSGYFDQIKNIYVYSDYIIILDRAYKAIDGSFAYQTVGNIIEINNDTFVTKNGIYDAADDIFFRNNSLMFLDYNTIYLSDESELYYMNNNTLVKTSKTNKGCYLPAVNNIEEGNIYIGSVTPVFSNCIAYFDGKEITSGTKIMELGKHNLTLISAIGAVREINFIIESSSFNTLKFNSSTTTLNLGQSYTTTLNSALDASNFIWNSNNDIISIKSDGIIVAQKSGTSILTATTKNGKYSATMTVTVTTNNVFDSSNYPQNNITLDGGYAFGLTDKTTLDTIKSIFGNNATANAIGTGKTLTVNGASYIIIIKGDINGDGIVDAKDHLIVKRACLKTFSLSEVQRKAACFENTAIPTSKDYLKIKRYFLGTFNLYS